MENGLAMIAPQRFFERRPPHTLFIGVLVSHRIGAPTSYERSRCRRRTRPCLGACSALRSLLIALRPTAASDPARILPLASSPRTPIFSE